MLLGFLVVVAAVVLVRRRPRQTGPARPQATTAAPLVPRRGPTPREPSASVPLAVPPPMPTPLQPDLTAGSPVTSAVVPAAVVPPDVVPTAAVPPDVVPPAAVPPALGPRVRPGQALLAVSGIGQRSAAALAAAGIGDLVTLAASDPTTLADALATAGLRRSPTLSAWPAQARRLLEG